MTTNNQRKIFTVFAGRKKNIDVQKKYLEKAIQMGLIDEVHYWNITRNKLDEDYLKSISNLKRSSSTNYNYIQINPIIINNTFELNVKTTNDIHIKISNRINNYEIVIGGWTNTKSVVRENDVEIYSIRTTGICIPTKHINIQINCSNNKLYVNVNGEQIISVWIDMFIINDIYFKTGHGSIANLKYDVIENKGFYFMDTCIKNWSNYYTWYVDYEYTDDIIFKSDDDILFFDLKKFQKYVDFINSNNYDAVFANIINNGVAAYFQQNKLNLIPKSLMELEYPIGGECGTLWKSGIMAENLHTYFIENYLKFINSDFNSIYYKIDTRFSINFFGFKGKNWYKIKDAGQKDDEYNLTIEGVKTKGFNNVMYADFFVSHLSFYKQEETKINSELIRNKYEQLALVYLSNMENI